MRERAETVAFARASDVLRSLEEAAAHDGRRLDRVVMNREALDDALDASNVSAIYVYRLSDLGERVFEVREFVERLVANDIEFTSVVENLRTSVPGQASLLLAILGAAAEMDHRKLINNLRKQFALRGGGSRRPTGGQRYGQRPFEDEAIAYMVRLRLGGMSHDAIAKQVNSEGIPAVKKHGVWSRTVVRRLLNRVLSPPG